MTWLVWRQHRKQLLFGVVALLVLGAFFVGTGMPIHDRFEKLGLADCLPEAMDAPVVVDTEALDRDGVEDPPVDEVTMAVGRCVQSARDFFGGYSNVIFVGLLLLVLPMLAGMFWGAPLVAREIEHGTHRLAWTQGVSRFRWASTKIGLVSVAVLVMTAIYAGMLTWWITPVMQTSGQRFAYIFFDIHGIVVFGYTLFALALGVFAGAVTGRMLPAMATTVVGFLGTRLVVMLAARTHYMPTKTRVLENIAFGPDIPQMRNDLHGDWIIASHVENTTIVCPRGDDTCSQRAIDQAYEVLTIHPAGDFWAFQAIETAIFVALAVGLVLATIYWIRRRIV
jgi:ABC-type transport system involved in multi-copper enzyme maturation permease subunit